MQLAKVVITSPLVLAARAERLPKGKDCVLKCTLQFSPDCIPRLLYLSRLSMNFNVLTMCTSNE